MALYYGNIYSVEAEESLFMVKLMVFCWLALLAPSSYAFLYRPHEKAAATQADFITLASSVAALKLVINLWVYVLRAHCYELT